MSAFMHIPKYNMISLFFHEQAKFEQSNHILSLSLLLAFDNHM